MSGDLLGDETRRLTAANRRLHDVIDGLIERETTAVAERDAAVARVAELEAAIRAHRIAVQCCEECSAAQASSADTDDGRLWCMLAAPVTPERDHPTEHEFQPATGHPDDDECTYRVDGTDATYCGETEAAHDAAAAPVTPPETCPKEPSMAEPGRRIGNWTYGAHPGLNPGWRLDNTPVVLDFDRLHSGGSIRGAWCVWVSGVEWGAVEHYLDGAMQWVEAHLGDYVPIDEAGAPETPT